MHVQRCMSYTQILKAPLSICALALVQIRYYRDVNIAFKIIKSGLFICFKIGTLVLSALQLLSKNPSSVLINDLKT